MASLTSRPPFSLNSTSLFSPISPLCLSPLTFSQSFSTFNSRFSDPLHRFCHFLCNHHSKTSKLPLLSLNATVKKIENPKFLSFSSKCPLLSQKLSFSKPFFLQNLPSLSPSSSPSFYPSMASSNSSDPETSPLVSSSNPNPNPNPELSPSLSPNPNSTANPNPNPNFRIGDIIESDSGPVLKNPEIGTDSFFCPPECLTFAHFLADEASTVIKEYFRIPIHVQLKMDRSPVTIADESVERKLRQRIRETFPDHGILGEEGGVDFGEGGNGDYVWVLDPIDGTSSFISGKPLFGVLIALLHNGVPVLGVLDQPILKERWVGVKTEENSDFSTTFNGNPVRTRNCDSLSLAHIYSTSPHLFSGDSETAFTRLRKRVLRTGYGCDCYAFGLLALGFVDIVVEFGMKPWDYLALVPIVEGAGGIFTDWEGKPLRLRSFEPEDWVGECLAAGDREAHKAAMAELAWKNGKCMERTV